MIFTDIYNMVRIILLNYLTKKTKMGFILTYKKLTGNKANIGFYQLLMSLL